MSERYTIMFVCTGNTCRSPMAEAALRVLLKKQRPDQFEVMSSGVSAANNFPATMYAGEAVRMWDADLGSHRSQQLSRSMIDNADLILAMSPEHYRDIVKLAPWATDKVFLFKKFPEPGGKGEGVTDPIGQGLDRYNETFLEIGEVLGQILPEIIKRIDAKSNVT